MTQEKSSLTAIALVCGGVAQQITLPFDHLSRWNGRFSTLHIASVGTELHTANLLISTRRVGLLINSPKLGHLIRP
jgi:hypothetical protein